MTAIIRPSEDGDVPVITDIYAHAVLNGTASFEIEPPDVAEMMRRRGTLLTNQYPFLVAETDGAVIGYAYAGPYRARPAYRHTVEDSVYVAPRRQVRGIGRALLTALIKTCEQRGDRQMVAVIGDSGSTGSIRLHEAMGFRLVGVIEAVGFKHGRWLDSIIMQRPIGPGAATPPETASLEHVPEKWTPLFR